MGFRGPPPPSLLSSSLEDTDSHSHFLQEVFINADMLRLLAATSRVGASRCATLASVRAPVAAIAQRRWLSSGGVVEVPIPLLGAESIVEGNILSIAKKVGDYVAKEEMVAEIETDKVTIEAKSPEAGTITAIHVAVDQTVEVGKPFFSLAVGQSQAAAASAPAAAAPAAKAAPPPPAAAAAPPPPPPKPAAPKPAAAPAAAAPAADAGSRETRVKMTRMRLAIAKRLKEAQNETAMLTTFNEVDLTTLTNMRNEYKDIFLKRHGVKLGFMSPFVAAAAKALKEQPAVNAVIDDGHIVYRDYVDISVAVSSPTGLVVPVLREAQNMSFADIERGIGELGAKAKEGKLTVEDMAGGTFSITNGGVFGSLLSTPIINPPQSAILGMHGIFPRPMAIDGKVEIRPMMYIALTYDHRLIDGREAVTFLKRIKELVQDPHRFLLDC
jgi:2-oxoglutarate dehydrogenase E2 component (dihydrolipoamide succinyltransferase)